MTSTTYRPRGMILRGVKLRGIKLRGMKLRRPDPSGRSVLIAMMCLFLVVILASPLQTYLSRRAAVAASVREQVNLNSEVATLQQQVALWNEPAYVQRQARARLQYVRPGDTLYTVIGPSTSTAGTAAAARSEAKVSGAAHLPSWNSALWSSVLGASKAP